VSDVPTVLDGLSDEQQVVRRRLAAELLKAFVADLAERRSRRRRGANK
jgi:hypothetical protein